MASDKQQTHNIYYAAFLLQQKLTRDVLPAIPEYAEFYSSSTCSENFDPSLKISQREAPKTEKTKATAVPQSTQRRKYTPTFFRLSYSQTPPPRPAYLTWPTTGHPSTIHLQPPPHAKYTSRHARTHTQRALQDSHNDPFTITDQTTFRRKNRDQQGQRNKEDLGAEEDRCGPPVRCRPSRTMISSFLHQPLDKSLFAEIEKEKESNTSTFRHHEEFEEGEELPVEREPGVLLVDFPALRHPLEGTESQGHNANELIAQNAGQLSTVVAINSQFWFEILSGIPAIIEAAQAKRNKMNSDLASRERDNALRNGKAPSLPEDANFPSQPWSISRQNTKTSSSWPWKK